jgi:MoxR-like ATPase
LPGSATAGEAIRPLRIAAARRQAIMLGAKIIALLAGRYNVAFEDIAVVAPWALRHRLILNFEGLAEGVSADRIVVELLERLPDNK